jgi:hypothetical protein
VSATISNSALASTTSIGPRAADLVERLDHLARLIVDGRRRVRSSHSSTEGRLARRVASRRRTDRPGERRRQGLATKGSVS